MNRILACSLAMLRITILQLLILAVSALSISQMCMSVGPVQTGKRPVCYPWCIFLPHCLLYSHMISLLPLLIDFDMLFEGEKSKPFSFESGCAKALTVYQPIDFCIFFTLISTKSDVKMTHKNIVLQIFFVAKFRKSFFMQKRKSFSFFFNIYQWREDFQNL